MGNSQTSTPNRGSRAKSGQLIRSYLQISCYTIQTATMPYTFDYKDKKPLKEVLAVSTSGIAVKDDKKSPFMMFPISHLSKELNQSLPCGIKFIVHRNPGKKGFVIEPIKITVNGSELQKSIWKAVKYMPKGKYVCKQGDIFRLGLQKFKIKQLVSKISVTKNELNTKYTLYQNITKSKQKIKKDKHQMEISSSFSCRICLSEGTNDDPLIPPCSCLGSMKYIHLKCLRDWLDKKLQYATFKDALLINWKPLMCELCKSSYMHQIYLDGKKHYTVDIPVPERPYIVIEVVSQEDSTKVYQLISFAKNKTQIVGRSQAAGVCLPGCVSVSRVHSIFSYNADTSEFIFQDVDSRYGTLILQKMPIKVDQNSPVSFQIGNNLFRLSMIRGQDQNNIIPNNDVKQQDIFDNVIAYQNSSYDSKQQYSSQQSIQDFSKPMKMNKLKPTQYNPYNMISIRPFQTNMNESAIPDQDSQQQHHQIVLNIPKSPRMAQGH